MYSKPSPPPLTFGDRGELTMETITQADLTPEERERALVMLEAQHAYLDLIDTMGDHVVDPEGNDYDLAMMQPAVWASAWTLALNGFRRSGETHIKKRFYSGDQVRPGAYTWVDARSADDAAEELQPLHYADDVSLPPDLRALAAQRDGAQPVELPTWSVKPKITVVNEPRPEWMD